MVNLFSFFGLFLSLVSTQVQYEPEDDSCLPVSSTKAELPKHFKNVEWLDANKEQTDFLISDFLLKNHKLPQGDKIAIVQFNKEDTIVFFIAGSSFCSAESLSKKEFVFLKHLQ